ncbi:hypothetical protein TKK_0003614 [Trichogramma kaykai]
MWRLPTTIGRGRGRGRVQTEAASQMKTVVVQPDNIICAAEQDKNKPQDGTEPDTTDAQTILDLDDTMEKMIQLSEIEGLINLLEQSASHTIYEADTRLMKTYEAETCTAEQKETPEPSENEIQQEDEKVADSINTEDMDTKKIHETKEKETSKSSKDESKQENDRTINLIDTTAENAEKIYKAEEKEIPKPSEGKSKQEDEKIIKSINTTTIHADETHKAEEKRKLPQWYAEIDWENAVCAFPPPQNKPMPKIISDERYTGAIKKVSLYKATAYKTEMESQDRTAIRNTVQEIQKRAAQIPFFRPRRMNKNRVSIL